MRLENKVAIVTGGGRGLGRAYCTKLAGEGAAVVVVDIDPESAAATAEELSDQGLRAISLRADVSSENETQRMADEAARAFGRIDVLVNNAAIFYGIGRKPFHEISTDEWDRLMSVNVKGCWLCARAVFPFMREQGRGKIINISSSAFFSGSGPFAHYVTSKGAVIGLTRALSKEMGEFGINVNAVAPGFTQTEAGQLMIPGDEAQQMMRRRSIKRLEQPHDVVGVVAFLASDDSDFITGQTILVDGGSSLH